MASPDDLIPSTSYSDPFYDRLDAAARYVRRFWWGLVLVFALVIVAMVVIRAQRNRRPEAAAAARFVAALQATDKPEHTSLLRALADDPAAHSLFRARASIELAQLAIEAGDKAGSLTNAQAALARAGEANDPEVLLAAKLSVAGALVDQGDLDKAQALYTEVERSAGGRFAAQSLEAQLGSARVAVRLGHPDEAISKLEPVIARNDSGANLLLDAARLTYWNLRRQQAAGSLSAAAAGSSTGAPIAPEAPALGAVAPAAPGPATPAGKP